MRRQIEKRIDEYAEELVGRYPSLQAVKSSFTEAYKLLEDAYERGGKLLVAGNGGSAADADHIVGELMKSFRLPRKIGGKFADALAAVDPDRGARLARNLECPLKAVSLSAHSALFTAYSNDVDGQYVFAQQVYGYGGKGDVFLGISTSGNSENVINAAVAAKAIGLRTIGLTGGTGGRLARFSDVLVCVPESEAYKVQELHLPVYHCWCRMLEEKFFGNTDENDLEIEDNLS